MLVLTRKKGESIMIGNQIEIVVLGIEGDALKLGIKAPKDVEVYRKEVYNAIRTANQEATQGKVDWGDVGKLFGKKEEKKEEKKE
ncbi:carbon storage regulator CsrA [Paenibacillus koleovorans]|uniref:carbon storage regulator CsrA n=1 Tax=Paenibacillus koleovorans TaxID=121608 RepID=UPI000FDC7C96|nr:carbon storage regulator CsrA [Paenibacillus koleovorans]